MYEWFIVVFLLGWVSHEYSHNYKTLKKNVSKVLGFLNRKTTRKQDDDDEIVFKD